MPDGTLCEYGTSPNPQCDVSVYCHNGTWSVDHTYCPPGTCLTTYADVPQGQACMPNGLDCAYAQGQCNCSASSPAGPGPNPTWQCFQPQGCPEPRPRIGSPCTQPGQSCDYGACAGGVSESCTGGYWQQQAVACPG